ncbi:hypothetical protein C1H46_004835 [Malus baccata]|uniref:Serine/threonine specific protein phosphatases domain-containing protein n=1 Tax=Malus baccata TaxID=106549 RepID=A0A540NF38_MALBA|nr:hypothetical protein C1H46_004835 [Malus baccata]
MHGGLSPELNNLNQINTLKRPTDVPDSGLLCDLLRSDPSKDIEGWGPNDRVIGEFPLPSVLVVKDGYEFFADKKLVTIFSALNYCGEFDNDGAMMNFDESLKRFFQKFKPCKKPS